MAADEPLAETLILLISELVTNAVVHTGCPAVLCMLLPRRCGGEGPCETVESVRVEVADTSSRAPHHRQAEGGDTGGRGLELVSGLADRWGWEHEPGGKRVWCELDAAPPEPGCVLAPPVYGEMRGGRAVGESRAHPEAARLEGGARSRTETRSDATMPMRTRVNVVEAGAGAFG